MKQRFITAGVLLAIFVPILIIGGIPFVVTSFILICIACYEVLNLFKEDWSLAIKLPVYLCFILGNYIAIYKPDYFVIILSVILLYLLFLVVQFESIKFQQVGIVLIVFILLFLTVASIWQQYSISNLLVIYTIAGTLLTDSFALFCGKAFGKHKLNERISPKKTIEGSIGGFIVTTVFLLIYGFTALKQLPASFIITSSLLLPIIGQIGDLAFSAIKRVFNVKDYGTIFPGHGGVLDRMDSITFNSLLMYSLIIILL